MAENEGLNIQIRRGEEQTTPPELRGGGLARQLPNVLGGIGLAATLGPVGLLGGVAAALLTRREHKIAAESWQEREAGTRQLNADFQTRANVLANQFTADAQLGDEAAAMNLAQLDDSRQRFAQGAKLALNADADLRALGINMMNAASGDLGLWLEDIETQNEKLAGEEMKMLRGELSGLETTIRMLDDGMQDIDNRYERAAAAWNEADNDGQRRAIFDDFIGTMVEDFGDSAVMTGVASALGAGAGALVGGPLGAMVGGTAAGGAAGEIVSALTRRDVQFDASQMLRIINAVHNEAKKSAQVELQDRLGQHTQMQQRYGELNRYRQAPRTEELIRATRENTPLQPPPSRDGGLRRIVEGVRSGGRAGRNAANRPTEELP